VRSRGLHPAVLRICGAIWKNTFSPDAGKARMTTFENGRFMLKHKRLVATLWFVSSLALVASVPVGPMRTSGFGTVSPHYGCLNESLVVCPSQMAGLTATRDGKNARPVVALYSEEEERDDEQESAGILPNVLLRLTPPRSFSRIAHHSFVASYLKQADSPLRC
jgi:hypothetical protein